MSFHHTVRRLYRVNGQEKVWETGSVHPAWKWGADTALQEQCQKSLKSGFCESQSIQGSHPKLEGFCHKMLITVRTRKGSA